MNSIKGGNIRSANNQGTHHAQNRQLPPKADRFLYKSTMHRPQSHISEADLKAIIADIAANIGIAPGKVDLSNPLHATVAILCIGKQPGISGGTTHIEKNTTSQDNLQSNSSTGVAVMEKAGCGTGLSTSVSYAGYGTTTSGQPFSRTGSKKMLAKNYGNPIDRMVKPVESSQHPESITHAERSASSKPKAQNAQAKAQECTKPGTESCTPASDDSQTIAKTKPPRTVNVATNRASIEELIASVRKRLIIDPGLTKSDCVHIEVAYRKILTMKGFDHTEIIDTLAPNSNLRIRCVDGKHSKDMNVKQEAAYLPTEETLLLRARTHLDSSGIVHESMHIANIRNHYNSKCMEPRWPQVASAVYPYTEEESREFREAFYIGFEKIKSFKALVNKRIREEPLSPGENDDYTKYVEVLKTCLVKPAQVSVALTREIYHRTSVGMHSNLGEYVKLYQTDSGLYMAVIECKIPEQFVNLLVYDIGLLQSENYPGAFETVEIEAWALQRLSIEARNLIYPEAMAKREIYRARCT